MKDTYYKSCARRNPSKASLFLSPENPFATMLPWLAVVSFGFATMLAAVAYGGNDTYAVPAEVAAYHGAPNLCETDSECEGVPE